MIVERRSSPPQYWEKVLRDLRAADVRGEALEFAFSVARSLGLRDFELCASDDLKLVPGAWSTEFGEVRVRKAKGRKNGPAKAQVRRRFRGLFPPPPRTVEGYSLADESINLEIDRLTQEAGHHEEVVKVQIAEVRHALAVRDFKRALELLLVAWRTDRPDEAELIDRLAALAPSESCADDDEVPF